MTMDYLETWQPTPVPCPTTACAPFGFAASEEILPNFHIEAIG